MAIHFIKRFRRSSAQRLTVESPALYQSITVLMEYIAMEQLSPFLKPNWLSLVVMASFLFWYSPIWTPQFRGKIFKIEHRTIATSAKKQ